MNRKYSALFVKHEEVWIAIQAAIYFEAVQSIRKLGRKNISEIASEIAQFGAGRAVGILDQALISKSRGGEVMPCAKKKKKGKGK
jgi:hypothetical protein